MDDDLRNQKEVEFYAASVSAWYNTSLEHDKSLLTLSMASVGLLITPLTMEGIDSVWRLVLHLLAMVSFIACIISILLIFKENKNHIGEILDTDTPSDPKLAKLDNIAIYAFAAGIVFSSIIGVLATFHTYSTNKEKTMTNANNPKSGGTFAQDSFNGANALNKSFNQANNLKPAASQSSSNSAASATQPASPAVLPAANKK